MAKIKDAGGAPAPADAPEVHEETVQADGAALHVSGLGEASVALGEAVATKGPPAVGQGQVAERVDGPAFETTRLADVGDPRPAAVDRRDDFGSYLDDIAAGRRTGAYDAGAAVAVTRAAGRDRILPLGAPTVDPEHVPGRRVAVATAQVRRGGRTYLPGEPLVVDFRAHAELVPIGAIEATPWHELPDAGDD